MEGFVPSRVYSRILRPCNGEFQNELVALTVVPKEIECSDTILAYNAGWLITPHDRREFSVPVESRLRIMTTMLV